jgi:pyruvate dehydrogenase E2 component (dihydrolipoamide acetyltransferase)
MPTPIVMPSFGMYTAGGTLVTWLEPTHTAVQEGQPVLEIETDKATYEVTAPVKGLLHHVLPVGATLTEQMLVGFVLAEGEPPPPAATSEVAPASTGVSPVRESTPATRGDGQATARIQASPVARRLASENGIALDGLVGSGPAGRIVEADVLGEVARRKDSSAAHLQGYRIARRLPLTGMRRTIGKHLRQSLTTTASLTLTREVEADKLVEARNSLHDASHESIPFDAFFAKLLGAALREHGELNVIIEGDDLLQLEDVHVAVAVAVPEGLVAPVVREPDAASLTAVARQIRDLTARARAGALRAADLEGASSTISNLGGHGVDAFTPILSGPQSSILGVGSIRSRAVVRGGTLAVGRTCTLSLTFDHRATDGVPAARLLDAIARRMNDDAYLATLE